MLKHREGRTRPGLLPPYTLTPCLAQEALFGHIYSPRPTFNILGSSLALPRRSQNLSPTPTSAP